MKFERSKVIWTVAILSMIGGALASVLTQDSQAESVQAQPVPEAQKAPESQDKSEDKIPTWETAASGCIVAPSAIEDIKKHREEIVARAKELAAREQELKARETALTEEIRKLEAIRDEITGFTAVQKKEREERVAKVVETLQSMSPKAAAQLMSTLDEKLAVAAMSQLDTAKLAKIMNVMEPARSARLTEALAGVARARSAAQAEQRVPATTVAAAATIQSVKGGESENGHNDQQSASRSGLPTDRAQGVSGQGQVSR